MEDYGLFGHPLGHSFSPRIHALLGFAGYALWDVDAEEKLEQCVKTAAYRGANVTIPYKQTVMPWCDALTEAACRIGAVNTLVRRPDGTLLGDNTDLQGFLDLADRAGIAFAGRKVLVLGSGGTSRTVCTAVQLRGGEPVVISRSGENNYNNLSRHTDARVLVNTTPVGMFPRLDAAPLDLNLLPGLEGVLDVVYNPLRTRLVLQAAQKGIPCRGGLYMLCSQAAAARERWTGQHVPREQVDRACAQLAKEMANLVLIGMPGCGKSTLGAHLAQCLGRPLVETDQEIARQAGCDIPTLFAREGETAFRDRETAVLRTVCARGGQVISCGGGAPLREENRRLLRMNGVVLWVKRPLEQLATEGRPLSRDLPTLRAMAQARTPLYRACADLQVDNHGRIADCASAMEEQFDAYFCN